MIERLYDVDNLYESFRNVRKESMWKYRTQKYKEDELIKIIHLSKKLKNKTYKPGKPNYFLLNERGKTRLIESYSIEDKIVQGCLVNEILLPICRPKLQYDNAASLEDRGTDFFRKRLEKHLKDYARLYGDEGYILIGDFKKFFDNIWHDSFIDALVAFGADDEVINFVKLILKEHEVDVSYMSDEEYKNCMYIPFDSIQYQNIDKSLLTNEKIMRKSVGIGSHLAQVAGIITPYRIDNYVKIVEGIKGYGRYMDDFYIIHNDKEELQRILKNIKNICDEIGIILNMNKTQIVKISHRFTILKTQYYIKDSNLIKIPNKDTIKREKRKLIKFSYKLQQNEMSLIEITNQYKAWRNDLVNRAGEFQSIQNIDSLFELLFIKENNLWMETE